MPQMRWDDFHAAHHRPFMIFADLEGGRGQGRYDLLNRLVEEMALPGSYALHPEEGLIRLAFERDADAAKFAASVQARKTAREGGWAGQWSFRYDGEVQAALKALLPQSVARRPAGRTGRTTGRTRRRTLPV